MQENHEFEEPGIETGPQPDQPSPTKRKNWKQIMIGAGIVLAFYLIPAIFRESTTSFLEIWLIGAMVLILLAFLFLGRARQRDIGIGMLAGCALPLLLLMLLFGACVIGIGGSSFFNLFK